MSDPAMAEFVPPLYKIFARLQQTTLWIAQQGLAKPEEAGAAATDYLRAFGLVALGYMWARMAKVAQAKLKAGANGEEAFYKAKLATARFFFTRVLPEANAHFLAIQAGAKPLMELEEAAF
jgi:hypothetical protein